MLCHFLTMNTSKESKHFTYLFSHIRSLQGLFYHYALKSNGFYLLLHTKISRNIYQKVCFGNNTYSGIFTVISTILFSWWVVPTMNNMQSKHQWIKHEWWVLWFTLQQTLYFLRSRQILHSFSDYRDYRAQVSTLVDEFSQLFHIHPIS